MTSRLDELFEGMPKRLDVSDVAQLLRVQPKGVYRWINQGVIPAYKVGSSWLILRDELKDTLASGSNLAANFSPEPGEAADDDSTSGTSGNSGAEDS